MIEENKENTLEEQIYKSNYFCCTLKCFKRELAEGIRYKEKSYHEDISFTMELMCKAKTLLYFDEILYVYYKEENASTIDHYTVRKALDFTMQILEYLYFIGINTEYMTTSGINLYAIINVSCSFSNIGKEIINTIKIIIGIAIANTIIILLIIFFNSSISFLSFFPNFIPILVVIPIPKP